MASATCQVKDGSGSYASTVNGVDVTVGDTITIRLASSAGVNTWSISCVGTDETLVAATINASLTIDALAKTATFTAPAAGSALLFQSSVVDSNDVSTSTSFSVYTLTTDGLRVGAVGETVEGSTSFGWITKLNAVIRAAITVSFAKVQTALAAASSSISVNGQKITSLGTPTASTDAATKAYVDAVASGLSPKYSVIALSTTNVASLAGLATTIDGIAISTDSWRVLLTGQSTASQNGIWLVHSGAWTRPTDFATGSDAAGAYAFVERGTANASSGWTCTSIEGSAVVDTNNLAWTQFSGAGEITAGTGLTKSGNTLSLTNIVNAVVDSAAAIAGPKIAPQFGAQVLSNSSGATLTGKQVRSITNPSDANYQVIAADYEINFADQAADRTHTLTVSPTNGEEKVIKFAAMGGFKATIQGDSGATIDGASVIVSRFDKDAYRFRYDSSTTDWKSLK